MTERRGTKALELWCRRITDGYPGVNVQNMTTSWRDGLAFCAMIHHFRPDLINFDSLNKDDVYGNNELAFRTAAEHLGIPALLDAEDMASCSVPDRLSILTYLSQFYQSFGGSSPSRLALSRTKESSNEGITPVVAESTTTKVGPRVGMRREPCAVCGMPVFLAEKLVISRTPYHRTCFRCARCANQLTPGNYYETEIGEYCCETCPDEEEKISPMSTSTPIYHKAYNEAMMNERENVNPINSKKTDVYQRSLSDEEKTERRVQLTEEILDRRAEGTVESSRERAIDGFVPISDKKYSQTSQMRLSFMANHLLSEKHDDLSKNITDNEEEHSSNADSCVETRINDSSSSSPSGSLRKNREPEGSLIERTKISDKNVDLAKITPNQRNNEDNSMEIERNLDVSEGSSSLGTLAPVESENINYLDVRLADNAKTWPTSLDNANEEATKVNNHYSYLDDKEVSIRQDTKDKIGPDISVETSKRDQHLNVDTSESLSLVKRRLRMFESAKTDEITRESLKIVSSSPIPSLEEINFHVPAILRERSDEINEENVGISEIPSTVDSTVVEEKTTIEGVDSSIQISMKKNETVPPVVPKRANLKVRRDERSKDVKKSNVTVLSASGIDLSEEENYPKDLNPFGSDEENNEEADDENHEKSRTSRVSTNPFGSSSDDEEEESFKVVVPPRPATRTIPKVVERCEKEIEKDINEAPTKRRLKAPQINFNPFSSDDDDDDEDHESEEELEAPNRSLNTPVPKPRTIKQTADSLLSPWKNDLNRGEIYASNSSLASAGSSTTPGGTYRKKKPAPPPPVVKELSTSGGDSLTSSNTFMGSNNSLRTTPRARKAKPAPPPPMPTSTPCGTSREAKVNLVESPITDCGKVTDSRDYETWRDPKNGKDEANRSKQSMTEFSCDETSPYDAYTDKSVQGKWKRKKGPAPARPIPHRRKIKVMSLKDVKLELDEIEMQQQGLERQGVRLEQLIRDKAETGNATEDTNLGMDVEELVLELFALVNEKNELFRRQAELMLLRRQQRLEEEHADIEYQIRCLLCQPEATKTDFDKQREETLIQRLVEIVERRNEIVECLEMDRRREVEEDRSINTQMGIYAAKNKGDFAKELEEDENNRSRKTKKTKLKEKAKEKILRKVHKKDADKDVDETEVKLKRQNKKKWF